MQSLSCQRPGLPSLSTATLFQSNSDRTTAPRPALLDAVKGFHAASLRGEYYEDFDVNSKNFMDKSQGTQLWIAECHRLLDLCIEAEGKGRHAAAREAFELIFDLLRQIDECRDNIIFFADEGGSWQVCIEWRTVLPAWFRCLASKASATEYASAVRTTVEEFASYDSKPLLAAARKVATTEQRRALAGARRR